MADNCLKQFHLLNFSQPIVNSVQLGWQLVVNIIIPITKITANKTSIIISSSALSPSLLGIS